MIIAVSACLLGEKCKYSGGDNRDPAVEAFCAGHETLPVCPEVAGGLPVPRVSAEIGAGGRVRTRDGRDVTEAFARGAEACVRRCRERGAALAVLQPRSPSCGIGRVYDGSFSGRLVPGDGLFAQALRREGIPCIPADAVGAYGSPEAAAGGKPPGKEPGSPGDSE